MDPRQAAANFAQCHIDDLVCQGENRGTRYTDGFQERIEYYSFFPVPNREIKINVAIYRDEIKVSEEKQ